MYLAIAAWPHDYYQFNLNIIYFELILFILKMITSITFTLYSKEQSCHKKRTYFKTVLWAICYKSSLCQQKLYSFTSWHLQLYWYLLRLEVWLYQREYVSKVSWNCKCGHYIMFITLNFQPYLFLSKSQYYKQSAHCTEN